jgi:hypothetical protein
LRVGRRREEEWMAERKRYRMMGTMTTKSRYGLAWEKREARGRGREQKSSICCTFDR